MSYNAIITFHDCGDDYLTITSPYRENPQDMVISSIYNLLSLLDFGDNKFEDDVIDHLKMRIEELRNK